MRLPAPLPPSTRTTAGSAARAPALVALPPSAAPVVAVFSDADRDLMRQNIAAMQQATGQMADGVTAMETRPAQLVVSEHGKQVLGEIANDYRQTQRGNGNPDAR